MTRAMLRDSQVFDIDDALLSMMVAFFVAVALLNGFA
jgi:hypothetical protein